MLGDNTAEGSAGRSRELWGWVAEGSPGAAPRVPLCICGGSHGSTPFSLANRGTLPCGHQAQRHELTVGLRSPPGSG